MNPIPFQIGLLKFTIERHRSGFNRIHPSCKYLFILSTIHLDYFYLEKN